MMGFSRKTPPSLSHPDESPREYFEYRAYSVAVYTKRNDRDNWHASLKSSATEKPCTWMNPKTSDRSGKRAKKRNGRVSNALAICWTGETTRPA